LVHPQGLEPWTHCICQWHIRRSAWEYELNRTNAEGYAQTDRTLADSEAVARVRSTLGRAGLLIGGLGS